MKILSLKNVRKEYHTGSLTVLAVKDVSFDLNEGEFVVILGASGAGKTTLLNLLGGMDAATGGEQQRVAIARAIAKNPKLILCDEPTGALDYVTGKKILKLLQDLSRERNKLVIIVTHNAALKDMADKVIKIKSGGIESIETNDNPKSVEEIEW